MIVVPLAVINPVIPDGTAAVHEMDAFWVAVESETALLLFPEQMDWLPNEKLTVGEGLIVNVKLSLAPVQPAADGVTLYTKVSGFAVVFEMVIDGSDPPPLG